MRMGMHRQLLMSTIVFKRDQLTMIALPYIGIRLESCLLGSKTSHWTSRKLMLFNFLHIIELTKVGPWILGNMTSNWNGRKFMLCKFQYMIDLTKVGHFINGHFITGHFITGHFITATLPRRHFITRTLYLADSSPRGHFTTRPLEN